MTYAIHHEDGTPDKRYSIGIEGTGDRRAQYVARFCGDWVGCAGSRPHAVLKAIGHKMARENGGIIEEIRNTK